MADQSSLIVMIRCRSVGEVERRLSDALRSAGAEDVDFVASEPEHGGEIPVDPAVLKELGFDPLPENWAWLCGDLCFYVARRRYPAAARFLLVENDVWLSELTAQTLIRICKTTEAGAMAVRLALHERPQKFSRGLSSVGCDPTAGCIFPVVFATADVVDRMAELRRETLRKLRRPVNDEAILAGVVFRDAIEHVRLDGAFPELFGPKTFDTNPPHLLNAILRGNDSVAYHPALPLDAILARIGDPARRYNRHRLRRVLAEANSAEGELIRAALAAA